MDKAGVLKLRADAKLHPYVEERINELFEKAATGQYTIREQYGITKGRTDTTTYLHGSGNIIHVEFFGSASTVERDVLNLLQSEADKQIAIIIDPAYDPKVSENYHRNNPKKKFSTFWLSDFIDEAKEDITVGRLKEIVEELEIKKENKDAEVRERFTAFLAGTDFSAGSNFFQHLAIFPRTKLGLFEQYTNADQLFHHYDPLGVGNAANPEGSFAQWGWEMSHEAQYVIFKSPSDPESTYRTQVAIGEDGGIIFSFAYGIVEKEHRNLYELWLRQNYMPTISFAQNVFKHKKYNGMVDVFGKITGVKGFKYIDEQARNAGYSFSLREWIIYADEITLPTHSFTMEEFTSEASINKYFSDFQQKIQRSMNQRMRIKQT